MVTLKNKWRLLKGLMGGTKAYTGPFRVNVEVTKRCNLRCPGCRFNAPGTDQKINDDGSMLDMDEDFFEKLCFEVRKIGTKYLALTGAGEPFIHPKLIDFISIAKGMQFHVTVLTNGTLFNEDNIKALIDSKVDILKVSCWASTPDEYEMIHGRKGSFEKTVESLSLLSSMKMEKNSRHPSVTLHRPINRQNYKSVQILAEVAHDTGCGVVTFSPFKTIGGRHRNLALGPDEEDAVQLTLLKTRKKLTALGIKHNVEDTLMRYSIGEAVWKVLPCYVGWHHARIKVNGTVVPCEACNISMGDMHKRSLNSIWNSSKYRSFRKKVLRREEIISLGRSCDCSFCCQVILNKQIHKFFRWVSPFASQSILTRRFSKI